MPAPLRDDAALTDLRTRVERELARNILPFWESRAFAADGTLVGTVRDDLTVDAATPRHSVLASRILWTFAEAARRDVGGEAQRWMAVAAKALTIVTAAMWDDDHGGVVWSLAPDGAVMDDRKQVYAQAFAIYGLSAWARASGDNDARNRALALFELLETHARDREHGGYWEARAREWGVLDDMALSARDLNVPKSMNTNLHVLEAYTTLLDVTGEPVVGHALSSLLDVTLARIVLAEPRPHCSLFFTADWTPQVSTISFGHDIEASWLLWDALETLRRHGVTVGALAERTRRATLDLADAVLAHGVDADGGVLYEGDPHGVTDGDKHWWPQAEAVVGYLNAFQIGGDPAHRAAALAAWEFLDAHIIDHHRGEWHALTHRDGRPHTDHPSGCKIGPWKCPYHNARACMEVMTRIEVDA